MELIDAKALEQLSARVEDARGYLHVAEKADELAQLDAETAQPGF